MKAMTLGCDPEIFLVDANQNLISAIERIGGSKARPRTLKKLGKGFAVQEDNVALEYNIPPSASEAEFVNNVKTIMQYMSTDVVPKGLAFSRLSAAVFPDDQLQHPKALEFGCDPDFNAWTQTVNPRPKADNPNLRSCGGHVHIGGDIADVPALIRRCDLFLGVPSTLQDDGLLRRQLYGKMGAFRFKPFGGEYRTLSNYWVFNDALISWVWRNTQLAMEAMEIPVEVDHDIIAEAINNGNCDAARHLVEKYNIPLCV